MTEFLHKLSAESADNLIIAGHQVYGLFTEYAEQVGLFWG